MALEDTAVLVESLSENADLKAALTEYESRRKPRARWVQTQSRNVGRIGQLEWGWLCGLRNTVLRLVPDSAADGALRKLASQAL
jgi:2-polyprenyl-6-methoxyphenol hydroxylase-like FAD-dependent oxidoreductase